MADPQKTEAPLPEPVLALIRLALAEDVGAGDVTTEATIAEGSVSTAEIVARSRGVLSGLEVARAVARAVDPAVSFKAFLKDGDRLEPPAARAVLVARLSGSTRSLLTMERTLLNFLQRLSGVATQTARYVEAVHGTGAVILDTRKTTPGFRALEKAAVRHGGGENHRQGLFDAVMIKDNHIEACGRISAAVSRVRASIGQGQGSDPQETNGSRRVLPIIVEARREEEVREAAGLAVDQILLDNMEPARLSRMVALIREVEAARGLPRTRIEASGGITLENVRAVAEAGVDVISVGALTHSAPALDIAMKIGPGAERGAAS